MKECVVEFLDQNGNLSQDYYGNLSKGQDVAKKIYLQNNAKYLRAKFQKNTSLDLPAYIMKSREDFQLVQDQFYQNKELMEFNRATQFLDGVKNPFQNRVIAENVVFNNKVRSLIFEEAERFGLKPKQAAKLSLEEIERDYPGVIEEVENWVSSEAKDFTQGVEKVLALWKHKEEGGTEAHNVLETYVNLLNTGKYYDEDGDLLVKEIQRDTLENFSNRENYVQLLNEMQKFIRNITKNGKVKLNFETEVIIYDEKTGLAGRIDLLVYDQDHNVYIFDYKTKERNKEWLFDTTKSGFLKDPMGHLYDNKKTHGELQTSLYRLMLENNGFTVKESRIIYIEADVKDYGSEYRYENFSFKKDVYLNYHKDEIAKFILNEKGVDVFEGNDKVGMDINDSLAFITGKENFIDEKKDIDKRIEKELQNPLVDKNGKEYFWNYSTGQKKDEYYTSEDPEKRKQQLRKYFLKQQELEENLSNDLINFFNEKKQAWKGRNTDASNRIARRASALLSEISIETHILERVNNISGFEGVTKDLLIARNRFNNEAFLINLSHDEPFHLGINKALKSNPKDKNIFTRQIDDNALKYHYGLNPLEATDENLKLLRAALVAQELKRRGLVSSIKTISNGSLRGNVVPTKKSMQILLPYLKVLNDKFSSVLPESINKNLNSPILMNPNAYNNDYKEDLFRLIETDFTALRAKDFEEFKSELYKNINNQEELLKTLIKGLDLISKNKKIENMEQLSKIPEAALLANLILQLENFRLNSGEISKKMATDKSWRGAGRIGDKAVQLIESRIRYTEHRIKREFEEFRNEHTKLMQALMKEKSHLGLSTQVRDLFENMYKVNPYENNEIEEKRKSIDDLMVLKEPNSKEFNELSKAEQNYILFFNKMVEKGFELVLDPKQFKDVEEHKSWKKGTVPFVQAGVATQRELETSIKDKLKITLEGVFSDRSKNTKHLFEEINASLEHSYLDAGQSNNKKRLERLGFDQNGNTITDNDFEVILETDLEKVLNRFMSDSLRKARYEKTLGLYKSLNLVLTLEENENFNKTKEVRDYIDNLIKLKVFIEYNDEGSWGKVSDNVQSVISPLALGLSPRTMLMELSTNMFASASMVLQEAIAGKDKRWSFAEYSRAGSMIIGDSLKGYTSKDSIRAEEIIKMCGIYNNDSEAQARAEFQEARRRSWFQSKWLYALNNVPYRYFKAQSFIAELIHMGIIDKKNPAWILNEEGVLEYNPANDSRWHGIFEDTEGKILKKINRPGPYTGNENHPYYIQKKYIKFLEEMQNEGNLDSFGRPKMPLTVREISSIKDYASSVYGSIDKDAKSTGELSAWGRQLLKFKSWMIQKKDNYWTTSAPSEIRGSYEWIPDPELEDGGYVGWRPEEMEGIIQTMAHMMRGIKEAYRGKNKLEGYKMVLKGLNKNQRANMRKLGSDVMLAMILTLIFGALFDDDEFKSGPGKLFSTTVMSSITDINVLLLSDQLLKSGPFATASFLSRGVKNLYETTGGIVTGDWEAAATGGDNLFRMSGVGKTIDAFTEE